MIQVYTGNGKGKSTAAIGQAIRASGNGMRTFLAMFLKNTHCCELQTLKNLSNMIELKQYSDDEFLNKRTFPSAKMKIEVEQGFNECKSKMLSGKYDLIVLDEILMAVLFDFIRLKDLLAFLALRSDKTEIILTGIYCPEEIRKLAYIVTEMKDVSYIAKKNMLLRKGLEC